MNTYRIMIPVLIVIAIAILALVIIYYVKRHSESVATEERLAAEKRWTGTCEFDNPNTGAKCQREEFHLENHYREVNGKLSTW